MSSCERNENGRVVDPITLEEVPEDRVISFEQLGVTFCFDIESLSSVLQYGRARNPINRKVLPVDVIRKIYDYTTRNEVIVYVYHTTTTTSRSFLRLTKRTLIGDLIIMAIEKVNYNCQLDMLFRDTGESLYRYPLTTPLSDIAGNAHTVSLIFDDRNLSPDYVQGEEDRCEKVYQYAHSVGRVDIVDLIPPNYRPYIPEQPDALIMEILSEFVLNHRNKPDRYIIVGMTKLLADAKITARFANALYRGIMTRTNRSQALWLEVLHLLYSRVVDPSNLKRDNPIQEQYYLTSRQWPTFVSKYDLIRQGIREGGEQRSPPHTGI